MEKLIEQFVHSVNDGIQISDIDGNIQYMNPVAQERLGISGNISTVNVRDFEPIFENQKMWDDHIRNLRDTGVQTIRSKNVNLITQVETPVEVTVFIKSVEGEEFVFAISRNIEKVIETEERLELREKMLKAIADTSKELSFSLDFYESIAKSLPILGEAVEVDRTYLFEFHVGDEGESLLSQRMEWNSGVADPQIDNPDLQNLPVEMFEEFMELMRLDEPFQAIVDKLPDSSDMKEVLAAQGIITVLIIPVIHKDRLWGFIGYDDCSRARVWDEAEISILRTFSGNLSLNIERQENLKEIQSFAAFPLQNPAPVIRIDEKGKVLLRNHYSKAVEGRSFKVNGGEWTDFESLKHTIIDDLYEKEKDDHYYEINIEDGSYYSIIPKYIKDQGYINLYFNDITALKQTQEKLETAQQSIDRIVSNMRDVIWSVDMEKLVLNFVSPSVYDLLSMSERELSAAIKSSSLLNMLASDTLASLRSQLEQTNDITDEVTITINGKQKWINLRIKADRDENGDLKRLDGYIIDITEKRLFEESLKLQERKFRGIIANMNLGLLEVDLNDKVIYTNDSFEKISGYSESELIGKRASDLFLNKSGQKEMSTKNEERKSGGSDSYELEVITKTGQKRWWLISGAPNYDENGKLIGSLGIHLDITEQKRTQAKMLEAQKLAEESSAAKEQFIANMSHEIRTPLNAIVGLSNQLKQYQQQPEGREYVDYIISSGNHLQSLIDNILDFSKINAGKFQLEETNFDFREVYTEIKSILFPLAEQKGLYFDCQFDEKIHPLIHADRTRIKQVLINILSNAIKFTEEGGVIFEVSSGHLGASMQVLNIVVQDTGVGMTEEFVTNVFEKFTRADNSSIRKESGTGLGMAITKELLKLMNGTIEINSELGEGTTIKIELPVVRDPSSTKNVESVDTTSLDFSDRRILVVEDNELNLLVTKGLLKKYKVIPYEAKDGVEALEAAKKEQFDLILMDIQMPRMDGIETTEKLIKEFGIKTPIVALSANALKTEIDRCYAAGMVDYLTKPFREDEFARMLRVYLGNTATDIRREIDRTPEIDLFKLSAIEMLPREDQEAIIKTFVAESKRVVAALKDGQVSGETDIIRFQAHKLKGHIKMFEIKPLYEIIHDLEQNLDQLNADEISLKINSIEQVLSRVYSKLN